MNLLKTLLLLTLLPFSNTKTTEEPQPTIGILGGTGEVGSAIAFTLLKHTCFSQLLLWGRNQNKNKALE